jgi:Cu+-exporting ATPase
MDAKDPVCGMDVERDDAAGHSNFEGKTFYFCSNECKEKFDQNPQTYVESAQKGAGARA